MARLPPPSKGEGPRETPVERLKILRGGMSYTGRVDDSGDEIIRIISARPAERRERKRYHEA